MESTSEDFFALAVEKYQSRNYPEAIEIFKKSLVIHEHWQSYQGLGWALSKMQRNKEAIDVFNQSLALHEHWQSYQGLGLALLNNQQYQTAIDAFKKALALNKDYQSYKGLGWALFKTQQFKEAIPIFQRSISLKEDADVYKGLGEALLLSNKTEEAIKALRNALLYLENNSNKTDNGIHKTLANAYTRVNNLNSSIQSWETYYSNRKIISSFDPFLGYQRIYEHISNDNLKELRENCSKYTYDFHASFAADDNNSFNSWRYLMYLHIPKCGGTNFQRPLSLLIESLYNARHKNVIKEEHETYFSTGDLCSDDQVQVLKSLISSDSFRDLSSAFCSPHGATWSLFYKHLSKSINSKVRIVTTVRDPLERLKSQIKHRSYICNSMKDLMEHVDKSKNDPHEKTSGHFWNNCMHRYIFDNSLNSNQNLLSKQDQQFNSHLTDSINFIDISDTDMSSKIRSAFLSSSLLPNIVQYSRINNSSVREKKEVGKLSTNEIDYVFKYCLDSGYAEQDKSIDFNDLKSKTLNRLKSIYPSREKMHRIHPIIFFISKDNRVCFLKTKEFIKNPTYFLEKFG